MPFLGEFIGPVRNRKYQVSMSTLRATKSVYLGLYRHACLQLYANGLINDPTFLSLEEVTRSLMDEGFLPQSVHGKVALDPQSVLSEAYRLDFENGILEADSDFPTYDSINWSGPYSNWEYPNIARMFYIALYLREQVQSIDKMYVAVAPNSTVSGKKTISINVAHARNNFKDKSKFPVTEATLQSLLGPTKRLHCADLSSVYWDYIYQMLNIDISNTSTSLFVSGMSLDQERSLLDIIISGGIPLNGECGADLLNLLREKVWSRKDKEYTLLTYIQSEYGDDFSDSLYPILREAYDTKQVVNIAPTHYVYTEDTNQYPVTVGQACIDSDGKILDEANLFYGVTGEFVDKDSTGNPVDSTTGSVEMNSIPTCILVGNNTKNLYDLEFSCIAKDLPADARSRFRAMHMAEALSFQNNVPDTILEEGSALDLVSALRLSYQGAEAGYFGPVFTTGFQPKALQQAIKMILDETDTSPKVE